MIFATTLLLATAVTCYAFFFLAKLRRRRLPGEPPIVPGHPIWGNGKEFNDDAVSFLHGCTREHGDVFSIRLLHYYMTVVTDPHSFDNFSRERNFDFDPIQEQVSANIFGFVVPHPRNLMKAVGQTTRGPAVPRNITNFRANLDAAFDGLLLNHPSEEWVQDGLKSLASKTIFKAIFNSIFGRDKETKDFRYEVFYENLLTFHKYFNYVWIGMPHFLFPEACKALKRMLVQPTCDDFLSSPMTSEYLKAAIEYMRSNGKTDDDIKGMNLVYLHINVNTFKIAFWCMYNLLSDSAAQRTVKTEIDGVIKEKSMQGGRVTFSTQDIEDLKFLDSAVKESFRLASGVFMVRHNQKDTHFTVASSGKTYVVREGDKVCMYPPAIHKDPEIFEKPTIFQHDRFVDQKFYKGGKELKNPLLPFGSICPGKKIALIQMKWFIISMLTKFDMELLPGEVAELDVQYHGHEILPPKRDVQIRYRLRADSPPIQVGST